MKKRTVSLLLLYVVRALCMGIAVFSFVQLLRVVPSYEGYIIVYVTPTYTPPPNAIETTIFEIKSNFTEWVNKTVAVEGRLSGPFTYLPISPEDPIPPWNYDLWEVSSLQPDVPTEKTHIGVNWSGGDIYRSKYVVVVGVVRGGLVYPICGYIEAQEVVLQPNPEWLSRTMQITGLGLVFIGAIVLIIPFPRPRETAGDFEVMNYGRYPKRGIEGIGMLWLIGLVLLLIGVVLQMVATLF